MTATYAGRILGFRQASITHAADAAY